MIDRLKSMPAEPVVEFTDDGYQSQLPDHQRSTAVQAIRNNLKSSELQLCDSLATRRQLVSRCSHRHSRYSTVCCRAITPTTCNRAAKYCDKDECMCVCLSFCESVSKHISGTVRLNSSKFSVCVTYIGPCPVLLWLHCNTLCTGTNGFVDDCMLGLMVARFYRRSITAVSCTS